MNGKPFFDTNILIYAFASNDPRTFKAMVLLGEGGIVSVQVLNEFAHVSRRKLGFAWDEVENATAFLCTLLEPPEPITLDVHNAALGIARERGLAFYDSLVVAAAIRAKCPVLYSEDIQDGQAIAGVTIRNPFIGL